MSAISENGVCAVKDKACVISPLAHSFSQLLLNGELSHLDSMDMDLLSILAQNIGDD